MGSIGSINNEMTRWFLTLAGLGTLASACKGIARIR
jgi:hypothetical protein